MNAIFFASGLIFLSSILQFVSSQDCISTACAKDTLQSEYGDIIYAGLIFRHGNRVPEKSYPTDPNANFSWPFELGQLVNEGKQRAYNLGRFFRPRYIHLAGNKYTPSKVITHGSSYDRTIMSGILFNAGFFPPSSEELWNADLQWQPIPIHSSPGAFDNILRIKEVPCPRLTQLRNDFYEKGEYIRNFCTRYADEIAHVEKHSGSKVTPCASYQSFYTLIILQDTLLVETEQNLPLPEWTKKVYPEPLTKFRDIMYVEVEDPQIKRLYVGPFLSLIASDFLNVAGWKNYSIPKTIYTSEPSQTPRLHLFAAHDTNVVMLLRTLGVYPNKAPNYSAAVGFELRKKSDQYYVTIIYENSLDEKPQVMRIPYCNGICTLQQFLSLVTPLMPANFQAECALDYSGPTGKSGTMSKTLRRYSNYQRVPPKSANLY